MFKWDGVDTFINIKSKKVLDVYKGLDKEAQNVQSWAKNNSKSQKWKLVYVDKNDKKQKTRTKGHNKKFGIQINRPFYLKSRLPMGRFVECWGGNNIILSDFVKGKLGMQFYFDEVSKTIKSQQWKDRSINI